MSARTFERRQVIRAGDAYGRDVGHGIIAFSNLRSASTFERDEAERIADELTASYKIVFNPCPDPRAPRIVRGKGQRRNRRRP